ncbi:MAG: hypothetical protein KC492_19405 [Myxococcales bacterium]|nr:hypothetical protein [Myxococcales bacterium]
MDGISAPYCEVFGRAAFPLLGSLDFFEPRFPVARAFGWADFALPRVVLERAAREDFSRGFFFDVFVFVAAATIRRR